MREKESMEDRLVNLEGLTAGENKHVSLKFIHEWERQMSDFLNNNMPDPTSFLYLKGTGFQRTDSSGRNLYIFWLAFNAKNLFGMRRKQTLGFIFHKHKLISVYDVERT